MIAQEEIVKRIDVVVAPILDEMSLELVEVEFRPTGNRWLVRIYIDRDGGVTIDDCERVSRELGRVLDVDDVIDHPYVLEVSSPGLTRPLKRREDFERYRGKSCKIITTAPVDGKTELRGEIVAVEAHVVKMRDEDGIREVPLDLIKKARLEFEL
jgi:ribosome maturation factor RimP